MNPIRRAIASVAVTTAMLVFLCSTATAQIPEFFYFQLNEGTGTTTLDLAVPGFGVTNPSMTSEWGTANPKLGFACMHDVAPANGQLNTNTPWTTGGGDFTIETWYYDDTGLFQYTFGDISAASFRCFTQGAAGVGNVILRGGGLTDCVISGGAPLQTWTHWAWVYDSVAGTMTGYLNGVLNVTVGQPVGVNISGTDFRLNGYSTTADLEGALDEFRFWGQARSAGQIAGFMNVELGASGFADDLACLSVDSPSSAANCSALSAAEVVNFTVVNFGTNTINIGTSFTADLVVNGSTLATENFTFLTTNHATYGTEQFAFATTIDMSLGGIFNIDVVLNYPGDQDTSNDTKTRNVDAGSINDIECSSVDSPLSAGACSTLSNAETVSFTVNNLGANTLTIGTAFTADLIVNGSLVTTEAFTVLSGDILCGGSASFSFAATLDLSAGGPQVIDVTLTYGGDVNASNDTATRNVDAGAPDDMAAGKITAPLDAVGCNVLTNTETVTFDVINMGSNTLFIGTSFTASLTHNGSLIATENFTVTAGDILCGGLDSFSFAATVDLSAGGPQTLDVALTYAGDVQPGNDMVSRVVNASGPGGSIINSYPYSEDFETFGTGTGNSALTPIQNGWQQDPNDGTGTNGDWWFGTATSSSLSGPETNGLGDHTSGLGGRFAHIEDSGNANPVINLWSPCFDLTGLTNPNMRLWVHSHHFNGGAFFNPVHVDLLTSGGTVTSIASVLADTGDAWMSISASLVPYIGQIVQFQIRGNNSAGFQYCDSSVDDFSIFEQAVLNGQAPQAGVATLDINSATNSNTNLVQSGDNGPYATSVASGGLLSYSISGEALAGILLVGGPLNTQVATYPGFGQFDIGNLPLNGAGIPGGLFVWADGITAPLIGLNQFFVLNATGSTAIDVGLPTLPVGVLTTFQCINTHSTQIIGFSNAVEVSIF